MWSRVTAVALFVSVVHLCLAANARGANVPVSSDAYLAECIERVRNTTTVGAADPRTFVREVVTGNRDPKIRGHIFAGVAQKTPVSEPYAFHTAVGCAAAAWLADRLLAFVESSPSFYTDDNSSSCDEKVTTATFDSTDRATLDRLAGMLSLVADVDAVGSLRTGVTALHKTVLALAARQARRAAATQECRTTVRLAIDGMVGVQRFTVANCAEPPDEDPRVFDLWAPEDGEDARERLMDSLTAVESAYAVYWPKTSSTTCSVPHTLLTNFAHAVAADSVAGRAFVAVAQSETVAVSTLRNRALASGDADATFLYYDSATRAVVKLVVDSVRRCSTGRDDWTARVIVDVRRINDRLRVADGKTDWPEYFLEAFEVLSNVDNDGRVKTRLDDCCRVGVEFPDDVPEATCKDSLSIVKNYLQMIYSHLDDLNCFNRLFRSVRLDRQKYYVPFANDKRVLLQLTGEGDDRTLSKETCDFVKNVYFVCYEAHYLFGKYVDNKSDEFGTTFLNEFWKDISDVKNYFLIIVKKGTQNTVVNKIAYDVATVLVNLPPQNGSVSLEFKVNRILNLIMNEMNGYEIKHCFLKNPVRLTTNKIDFFKPAHKHVTKTQLKTFLKRNLRDFTKDDLNFDTSIADTDYQFLSVRYFYNTFIKESVYYDTYKTNIKLNWKGSVQTLGNIFENESLLVLNVIHFYELYDVYFKYCAATIYFPVRKVLLMNNKLKHVNTVFKKIKLKLSKHGEWVTNFPPEMKSFLLEIDSLLNLPTELSERNPNLKDNQIMSKLKEVQNGIDKQFGKFNVVFKNTSKLKILCSLSSENDIEDYLAAFNEIMIALKIVYSNFSKIYRTSVLTDRHGS